MPLPDLHPLVAYDGSLLRLSVDGCTGLCAEKVAPDVWVIRVDFAGEESVFLQIRGVGRGEVGLRAVLLDGPP